MKVRARLHTVIDGIAWDCWLGNYWCSRGVWLEVIG